MATTAIVREVSASFADALASVPPDPPIDVAVARAQHAAYVAALREAGAHVIVLPAEDGLPDACFVEDCAVVAGGVALIARPGAPSRRDEVATVRAALAELVPVVEMDAPATLDGGDCLLLGRRLYVGRSARTNAAGAARAREVFAALGVEVVEVAVADALHLKSVCSPIGRDAVLVAEGALPRGTFAGARELVVPTAAAANVVVVGERALVPADQPAAAERVAELGLRPIAVDNRELRKADSALTCLSILVMAILPAACQFDGSGVNADDSDRPDAASTGDIDAPGGDIDGAVASACGTDANLVGCYRFETPGADDESAYDNDGTATGDSRVTGVVGSAMAFSPGSSVLVPDSASLDVLAISLEVWVKLDALPLDPGRYGILDNNGQYGLFVAPDGAVRCAIGSAVDIGLRLGPGVWSHVACTYDGTTIRLYQDGVPGQTLSTAVGMTTAGVDGLGLGQNVPSGDNLAGAIDELRIWKVARTAEQIAADAQN